ncbi:ABC transporter ATP-binding protein [Roseomonas frigidaquae]|uniref:ABC transporter ATP-binding protein n=1 Tax=Falsiroseomonas frigidaquae TaxID=487318 RepID=A0ABX1EW46_9PROT|nr:ABC transporter ATP-binding protein [Falsiroseomonas frigidaquae]
MTLRGIVKRYGPATVLDGIDLDIAPGEFLTLVGPSGCGKSTLLRTIAGFEPQDEGQVRIGDRVVDRLPPAERDVAMVFQSYALYPHMTVAGNIATPLEMRRLSLAERLPLLRLASPRRPRIRREIMAEVEAVARQLDILPLLARKPAQLSGGQRQRVALGRAMVRDPAAFLMDEPLSNLDARLRVQMRTELAELHKRLGATFVYVTHDQVEAMTMSDRVALMEAGRILQLGTPAALYDTPASISVARFIGSPPINLLPAEARADGAIMTEGLRLHAHGALPAGRVTLGLRPEALELAPPETPGTLPVSLRRAENLGAEWLLHAVTPGGTDLVARVPATAPVPERFSLAIDPARLHLFGADGQRLVTRLGLRVPA